jgi:hypothetical protein
VYQCIGVPDELFVSVIVLFHAEPYPCT